MQTQCTSETLAFQGVAGRSVCARFNGGTLTSDGGAVLLREVERRTGVLGRFADCFTDHRDPARVTHSVGALVRQRVYALALGYEDLNDHDALRHDPLLAILAEAGDLTAPLAGGVCWCLRFRGSFSVAWSASLSCGALYLVRERVIDPDL